MTCSFAECDAAIANLHTVVVGLEIATFDTPLRLEWQEGENTVHRTVGHQNWKEARMEGWNEGRKEGRVVPVEHEASPLEE